MSEYQIRHRVNIIWFTIYFYFKEVNSMAEEEKNDSAVKKSGEVVGDVAQKGVAMLKGFGKGVMKGFKKKDGDKEKK